MSDVADGNDSGCGRRINLKDQSVEAPELYSAPFHESSNRPHLNARLRADGAGPRSCSFGGDWVLGPDLVGNWRSDLSLSVSSPGSSSHGQGRSTNAVSP